MGIIHCTADSLTVAVLVRNESKGSESLLFFLFFILYVTRFVFSVLFFSRPPSTLLLLEVTLETLVMCREERGGFTFALFWQVLEALCVGGSVRSCYLLHKLCL